MVLGSQLTMRKNNFAKVDVSINDLNLLKDEKYKIEVVAGDGRVALLSQLLRIGKQNFFYITVNGNIGFIKK